MTDADIERWKPLRTRVLMGETLTESDQLFYHSILEELDRTETFPGDHQRLQALLDEVTRLRKEAQELREIEQSLDSEIERLLAAYRKVADKPLVTAA